MLWPVYRQVNNWITHSLNVRASRPQIDPDACSSARTTVGAIAEIVAATTMLAFVNFRRLFIMSSTLPDGYSSINNKHAPTTNV
jgi:hypothetical protein